MMLQTLALTLHDLLVHLTAGWFGFISLSVPKQQGNGLTWFRSNVSVSLGRDGHLDRESTFWDHG